MTKLRMQFLKDFDQFIKNLGDERILETWLVGGVPDEADAWDYVEIAEDEELWLNCVQCFSECCKMAGLI